MKQTCVCLLSSCLPTIWKPSICIPSTKPLYIYTCVRVNVVNKIYTAREEKLYSTYGFKLQVKSNCKVILQTIDKLGNPKSVRSRTLKV